MKNEHIGLILLSLFLLSLTIMGTTATTNANNENTLTLILKGGAIAEIQYQNNVTVPVYNSTTVPFNGTIKLSIHVPRPGLVLVVNGTKYYSGVYNTTINESTTICADAVQIYDEVTINLIGNGSVHILLYSISGNESALVLNKSASFKVDNETFISLSSDKSFIVNNDNLTTTYFAMVLIKNTTFNVNFNIQNISTSNLAKINLTFANRGFVQIFIDNISAYETLAYHEFNKSAVFYAPFGATVYIASPYKFEANGEIANLTESGTYVYVFNVSTNNNMLNISFILPNTSSITHANSTATVTKTFTEIENQTITSVPNTNTELYQGIIIILLISVIIFLATYIFLKERKKGN